MRMKQCFGKRTTFIMMMCLTTSFFFVEIIVGYLTNSMALVADSFHMLSDILSLFIGFFALRYSKKASSGKVENSNTFGLVRAEVLGALVNAVFLMALCFSIFVEALKRLIETDSIKNPNLVLIVGTAGLFINLVGLFLFQGHAGHGHSHGGGGHGHSHLPREDGNTVKKHRKEENDLSQGREAVGDKANGVLVVTKKGHGFVNKGYRRESEPVNYIVATKSEFTTIPLEDRTTNEEKDCQTSVENTEKKKKVKDGSQMNMKGVYLHILGDALGSIIVIVAALVVKYFDGKWTDYVDPGMSLLIVIIILKTTIPLMKESSKILLQFVPSHIQLKQLEEKMLVTFPEISNIHEFHVWQLTGSKIIASVHLSLPTNIDYKVFSAAIKEFFHHEGIHSTTVQPEFIEDIVLETEKQCFLRCISNACEEKLCCGQPKQEQKNLKHNDGIKGIKSVHITEITEQQSSINSVDDENRPESSFTSSTQETKEASTSANVGVLDTVPTN